MESFEVADSGSIVLDAMVEKNKPLLGSVCCPSLLLSPLPVFGSKLERKRRFSVPS